MYANREHLKSLVTHGIYDHIDLAQNCDLTNVDHNDNDEDVDNDIKEITYNALCGYPPK